MIPCHTESNLSHDSLKATNVIVLRDKRSKNFRLLPSCVVGNHSFTTNTQPSCAFDTLAAESSWACLLGPAEKQLDMRVWNKQEGFSEWSKWLEDSG